MMITGKKVTREIRFFVIFLNFSFFLHFLFIFGYLIFLFFYIFFISGYLTLQSDTISDLQLKLRSKANSPIMTFGFRSDRQWRLQQLQDCGNHIEFSSIVAQDGINYVRPALRSLRKGLDRIGLGKTQKKTQKKNKKKFRLPSTSVTISSGICPIFPDVRAVFTGGLSRESFYSLEFDCSVTLFLPTNDQTSTSTNQTALLSSRFVKDQTICCGFYNSHAVGSSLCGPFSFDLPYSDQFMNCWPRMTFT